MIRISTRTRTRETKQSSGGWRPMDVLAKRPSGRGVSTTAEPKLSEQGNRERNAAGQVPFSDRRNHGSRICCPGRSLHNRQIIVLACSQTLWSLREKGRSRSNDASSPGVLNPAGRLSGPGLSGRADSGQELDRIGEMTTLLAAWLNLAGVQNVPAAARREPAARTAIRAPRDVRLSAA
jgi:hypothetical protein